MDIKINEEEFEKQRYDAIIDSGKYIKLDMLIGKADVNINGRICNMPCVKLELHKVKAKEIGALYLCLEELMSYLEKNYPTACLTAKLTSKCSNLGEYIENNKEGEKK